MATESLSLQGSPFPPFHYLFQLRVSVCCLLDPHFFFVVVHESWWTNPATASPTQHPPPPTNLNHLFLKVTLLSLSFFCFFFFKLLPSLGEFPHLKLQLLLHFLLFFLRQMYNLFFFKENIFVNLSLSLCNFLLFLYVFFYLYDFWLLLMDTSFCIY